MTVNIANKGFLGDICLAKLFLNKTCEILQSEYSRSQDQDEIISRYFIATITIL